MPPPTRGGKRRPPPRRLGRTPPAPSPPTPSSISHVIQPEQGNGSNNVVPVRNDIVPEQGNGSSNVVPVRRAVRILPRPASVPFPYPVHYHAYEDGTIRRFPPCTQFPQPNQAPTANGPLARPSPGPVRGYEFPSSLYDFPNALRHRPRENQTPAWAVGKPLTLRLSKEVIGNLRSRRATRLQRSPSMATPEPSGVSVSASSEEVRPDNPTSFYKASSKPGFHLWPSLSLECIRQNKFVLSTNSKVFLKLASKYLLENAIDQLARYDPTSEVEPKWVLTKHNVYIELCHSLLRQQDRQIGEMCSCVPRRDGNRTMRNSIGCSDDRCENRAMNIECELGRCGSGEACTNSSLQKQEFPKVGCKQFKGKGYGLIALETIAPGTLICEYVGEVMPEDFFLDRVMKYQGERHFYFMRLTSKLYIDASRIGGIARFINHSCDPNCMAEKWNANGEPHVAIVAEREIKPMEEITFSYYAQPLATKPIKCYCGSPQCQEWLYPLRVAGTRDREPADEKRIVAQKIRQAKLDLELSEKILRKVSHLRTLANRSAKRMPWARR